MLNYVWLGLLMLGIGVALSTDLIESNSNKYQNGQPLLVELTFSDSVNLSESKTYNALLFIGKDSYFFPEHCSQKQQLPLGPRFVNVFLRSNSATKY